MRECLYNGAAGFSSSEIAGSFPSLTIPQGKRPFRQFIQEEN